MVMSSRLALPALLQTFYVQCTPDVRWLTCIQPLEPAEILELAELAELSELLEPTQQLQDPSIPIEPGELLEVPYVNIIHVHRL